jgi:hypothetical protein
MWIRSAFWEGTVKPGEERHFRRLIDGEFREELKKLPNVRNVLVLWPRSFEDWPSRIICQILMEFDDEEAMNVMHASPECQVLRGRMAQMKGLIDGTISHVNFETDRADRVGMSC